MTRSEARRYRAQIESSAVGADDAQALEQKWMYPAWKAGTAYDVGDRVRYGGKLFKCVQAHTALAEWTPDVTPALWTEVSVEEWPEWRQPTGAQDAYSTGDKVSHNGQHWISTVDANTWEPGVYGWEAAV